jgi:RNA polymerase sigma-70 factor (ECF subfamily)
VQGAAKIAAQAARARGGAAAGAFLRPVTVRGAAGALIFVHDKPVTVLVFTVRDGLITQIRSINDPERLAQVVPSWAA